MQDKDGKTAQGGSMTRQQAEQEMEQLRKVFPSVRMLTAEQVQAGEAVGDAARQALEEKTTHSRMEYRGQELYEVTALFAQVEGTPCVLELERRLDRIMLLDPEESEQLFNNLAEYRGKLYRDAVTGAYNERYYQEKYRSRILTAGVAVLRVDDFKAANDVYGRYAGNSVLETVAGVLRRNLGEKDRLIRRGEDRLLLLLPEVGQSDFGQKLEHLRLQLAAAGVPGYSHLHISVSIGGVWIRDGEVSAAVEHAERLATYAQMQKNTVITEQQPERTAAAPVHRRQSVLIVDDSELNRKMLGQMLGSVIPSKIEVTMMPGMGLNILPSLQLGSGNLLINGNFDTPLLNGALFHQSTFRDLFGLTGLSFTAGLRLDYEKMKMNYDSGTAMDYTVGIKGEMVRGGQVIKEIPMMPETALTVQSRYRGSIDKDYLQLLPKFALQYDFKDNLGNVYATVSKGYRSGGYNIQMFSDLLQSSLQNDMKRQTKEEVLKAIENSPGASYKDFISEKFPDAGENPDARSATEYKPEQTWNYEIGAHLNLFNNRLRTDAALFWLETRDQQISRFAGASGLGRETVNAGKSRSLGAELALAAAITTDFTLNTSYGYTYATFKDYVTNARVNGRLQEISYNGHYVPFVPKHTLTVGGQYIFRINPGYWLDRIQLNAGYTGAGRVYWTEENTVSQSFYGTLNGRVSLQKGRGQIDFWVRNALDKDYAAFYFESMGNGFMQKGRPIQAGIELRCRF